MAGPRSKENTLDADPAVLTKVNADQERRLDRIGEGPCHDIRRPRFVYISVDPSEGGYDWGGLSESEQALCFRMKRDYIIGLVRRTQQTQQPPPTVVVYEDPLHVLDDPQPE